MQSCLVIKRIYVNVSFYWLLENLLSPVVSVVGTPPRCSYPVSTPILHLLGMLNFNS